MKFWEAMKALEEGAKVRCKEWDEGSWIARNDCSCGGRDCFIYCMRPHNFENEWELYEEPQQTLSFADVIKVLKEGRRFRRKAWPSESILFIDEGFLLKDGAKHILFNIEDIEAADWIEVK